MNEATSPSREHDAVTIARLERLAARRVANGPATPRDGFPGKVVPRRRPHPSHKARVAALGLSLATTAGLTYTFAASASSAGATDAALRGVLVTPATTATTAAAPTTAAAATTATTAAATAAAPTTPAATTATTAATVNGAVYSNKYGVVQVQAVFAAAGSLTAVNVLQLPTDRKSVNINNRAVPALNSEALAAQSADVHTVSGATYTTHDYIKSLQSAIDTARAKGITTLV